MPSALDTIDRANYHHGRGLVGLGLGTAAGFGASVAVGTVYAKFRDKWYGKYSPYGIAVLGKAAAIGIVLASKGRAQTAACVANDIGQAGVNAIGLNLGVHLGLKLDKKKLSISEEDAALPAGYVRVAGDLPPAAPGRSIENLSVEDLANLR